METNVVMTKMPKHVVDAIVKEDLVSDTFLRATVGAMWLDENGPPEWRLHLMRIRDGKVSSRVDFTYNKDYPLSLAFSSDNRFSKVPDGERWVEIAEGVGFKNARYNVDMPKHGFMEKEHRVGEVIISEEIDILFLNEAWEKVLADFWEVGKFGWPPFPKKYPKFGRVQ